MTDRNDIATGGRSINERDVPERETVYYGGAQLPAAWTRTDRGTWIPTVMPDGTVTYQGDLPTQASQVDNTVTVFDVFVAPVTGIYLLTGMLGMPDRPYVLAAGAAVNGFGTARLLHAL